MYFDPEQIRRVTISIGYKAWWAKTCLLLSNMGVYSSWWRMGISGGVTRYIRSAESRQPTAKALKAI